MQAAFIHPLLAPPALDFQKILRIKNARDVKKLIYKQTKTMGFLGDLFDNIFDFLENVLKTVFETIKNIIKFTLQTVFNVIRVVLMTVGAIVGAVKWSEVKDALKDTLKSISNLAINLMPFRAIWTVLTTSDLTDNFFKELDEFTGGMITSAVNVSDLIWRVGRGDHITKEELLRNALFILQVAAVVIGGPAAAGGIFGSMVGRQVCENAGKAKEACTAAFVIAGAAAGGYLSAETGVSWGAGAAKQGAASVTSQAADAGSEIAKRGFTDYLNDAGQTFIEQRLVQVASREAIKLCQKENWVSDKACSILGNIAANYINAPEGTDWVEFLAQEAGRIGVSELLADAFPKNSPEHAAIRRRIVENTVQVPGQHIIYEEYEGGGSGNAGKALLAIGAAGAALLFLGGA